MKRKKFEVQLYYTGFSTHLVAAKNKETAILKARKEKPKLKEICSNLEDWRDADTAEEIKNGESTDKDSL